MHSLLDAFSSFWDSQLCLLCNRIMLSLIQSYVLKYKYTVPEIVSVNREISK